MSEVRGSKATIKRQFTQQQNTREEDSFSEDDEQKEMHKKQRQQLMEKVRELIYDDSESAIDISVNDGNNFSKELRFEILQEIQATHEMEYQKTRVATHQNQYITLVPMNDLQLAQIHNDKLPFLELRKQIMIFLKRASRICALIVFNRVFEFMTLVVIVFNSVMLAVDDPTTSVQTDFQNQMDEFFLIYYTIEAGLKILALGLIFDKGAYLRDPWNLMDLSVLITAYLPYIITSSSVHLNSLRSFRVLRPLRTVSTIKQLKVILQALIASLIQMKDHFIVMLFFYTIFAIAGMQMFSGFLKKRCINFSLGITSQNSIPFCSIDSDCDAGYLCGKQISNPQGDLISFDTFGLSFMQIFVITSLEGWTYIEQVGQLTFNFWSIVYFLLCAIIGAFFLINLTLAIIYINFAEFKQVDDAPETNEFEYWLFRKLGLYQVQRESIPNKFYGHTWDERQFHIQLDSLQEAKRRTVINGTTLPPIDNSIKKPKVIFNPIQNANQFSGPIALKQSNIKLQGIYGVGQKNILNLPIQDIQTVGQVRSSFLRKPTLSSNRDSNEESRKKSLKFDQSSKHSRGSQLVVDFIIDEQDENKFNRIAQKQQKTVIQLESVESAQESRKMLDIPGPIQKQRQHSFKQAKVTSNSPLQDQDELESIRLSELDQISEDEMDARLQEMDALFVQPSKEKKARLSTQKVRQAKPKYEIYKLPENNQLDEEQMALKNKWYLTKFTSKVVSTGEFNSEEDILITKAQDMEEKRHQIQQQKARDLKIQMTYCFKNFKHLIVFKKTSSNSNNSERQNSKRKESKLKSSKTLKKSMTSVRKIKPQSDDDNKESNDQSQRQSIRQAVMGSHHSQINKSLSQHQESARDQIQDLNQVDNIEENIVNEQIKKKAKAKKKVELTYEQYIEGLNLKGDEIIDSNKASLVEKQGQEIDYRMDPSLREIVNSLGYEEYNKIKQQDIEEYKGILTSVSSIEEVKIIKENHLLDVEFVTQMNSVLKSMNYDERNYFVWLEGVIGFLKVVQRQLLYITQSSAFTTIMNLAVFINTIILCLDGLVPTSYTNTLNQFNQAFTYIFTVEVGLKIIAQGPLMFVKDTMNIFDAIIVALSLVELFFLDSSSSSSTTTSTSTTTSSSKSAKKSSFSAFRSVRIFRAFRVLRVTKLMRSLKFMGFLMSVLSAAFESFMYIMLLLLLFLFIFTLLGMAFFGGQLNFGNQTNKANQYRTSWDSLQMSFIVAFDLLTIENWNNLLYELLPADITWAISIIYLVCWIILGNWIFLNLLLAILLDHFEEEYTKDKTGIDTDIEIAKDTVMEITNTNTLMASNKTINKSTKTLTKSQKRTFSTEEQEALKKQREEFKYFTEPGMCDISLWIFTQENPIRRVCYRIVKDNKFESLIFFMIFLTTVKLIVDTYNQNPSGELFDALYDIDIFFAAFFAMEMVLKMIAFGLYQQPNSYMRESWNVLDCFIVMASIVDVSVSQIKLSFVKILRLLRTLRPLRFISHNRSMKIMVTALLQSVNGIMNVFIMIILIWLMFSILGVNLIKNTMHHCDMGDQNQYYYTLQRCNERNGNWANRQINYDNVFSAMLSLFVTSTFEGWPDYLFLLLDGDEVSPMYLNHLQFSWFYIIFISINNFFLINLLVGVIFVNFHIAEEAARDNTLTPGQTDWIDIQKLIIYSNPNLALYYCPENKSRAYVFQLVTSWHFDIFIICIVFANVGVMAAGLDDAPADYNIVLDDLTLAFTAIFIAESALKIFALGPVGYIRNSWNQFDFFIVCSSILDILVTYAISNTVGFLKSAPQIIRVFRVLRVTRLFKIIKQFEGLRKLISTLVFALPAVMNVTALLFLVYFIFSILGCFLFSSITSGWAIDGFNNFSDFQHSFELLFRCSTGEDWYKVMFDTMTLGNYYVIYWLFFIVIQQNIIINLFVLVILDQYDAFFLNADSPLNKFQEYEGQFVEAWAKYATEDKGMKMNNKFMVPLLLIMEAPLGMGITKKVERETEEWQRFNTDQATPDNVLKYQMKIQADAKKIVSSNVMQMNIYSDNMGFVSYHQILYAVMKFYIYQEMHRTLILEMKKKTYKPMDPKLEEAGLHKVLEFEEEAVKTIKKKYNLHSLKETEQVNPIVQYLFVLMSFKALRRYGQKKRLLRESQAVEEVEDFSKGNSSDESFCKLDQLDERSMESDNSDKDHKFQPGLFAGIPNTEIYKNEHCVYYKSEDESESESDNQSSNIQESENQRNKSKKSSKMILDVKNKSQNTPSARNSKVSIISPKF